MKKTKKPLKKHAVPPGQTNAQTKTYDQLTDAQKQATDEYKRGQSAAKMGITDRQDLNTYIKYGTTSRPPQSKKGGSVSAKMKLKSKSKKK